MGIIDDGICFANERFRNRDGTRVEQWWLMDGPTNNPLGGHVLDKAAIDLLLAQCTNANGVLNEDLFYRSAELIDFRQPNHKSAAWQASHGTHVMDLACGFDPAENCDDRPIVCVQLPTRVTADVDNGSLLPYVALAIDFIVSSALQIAARPPRGAAAGRDQLQLRPLRGAARRHAPHRALHRLGDRGMPGDRLSPARRPARRQQPAGAHSRPAFVPGRGRDADAELARPAR